MPVVDGGEWCAVGASTGLVGNDVSELCAGGASTDLVGNDVIIGRGAGRRVAVISRSAAAVVRRRHVGCAVGRGTG